MPANGYFRKRRKRLMDKDPYCYWCGKKLTLYPDYPKRKHQKMPADYPTIDHLKSKYWGPRRDVQMKEKTLVLACPKCNNDRQAKEQKRYLFLTWWKSGGFPRWLSFLKIIRKYYIIYVKKQTYKDRVAVSRRG